MSIIKKIKPRIIGLCNRPLNRKAIKNKVFCIGLHKTGTTTLANYFTKYGFHSLHSTNWINDNFKLEKFDFFSDGGSHFDNINEFDFERLFYTYKDSKFILQTRDTKKWVISKLKHAGWNQNIQIQDDDDSKITHDDWTYKSLLTVQKFIEHKINYEKKVLSFFEEKDPNRLIVIDITQKHIQKKELIRLKNFLNLRSLFKISLPHSNKRRDSIMIPENVQKHINQIITESKIL